jgi:hypothetical protein
MLLLPLWLPLAVGLWVICVLVLLLARMHHHIRSALGVVAGWFQKR